MRHRDESTRKALWTAMSRRCALSAPVLAEHIGVSVPTLHRLLKEIEDEVLVTGLARRTRYGLRKAVRGDASGWPLYEVGPTGRAELLTHLHLVQPQGTCMSLASSAWPLPEESAEGWWDGLPYPLYDMRPQGYLGRNLLLQATAAGRCRPIPRSGRTRPSCMC